MITTATALTAKRDRAPRTMERTHPTAAAVIIKQTHLLKRIEKVRTTVVAPTSKEAYIQRTGRAMTMKVSRIRMQTNGWVL